MSGPALARRASERYPAERLSPWLVEVPRTARSDMRVPARLYADEELWRQIESDRTVEQLVNVATLPGIVDFAYAMPDAHEGYGFPVGGVAALAPRTASSLPAASATTSTAACAAPFHYGRWTFHRAHGWIWIPARVWGPAWVAWRYGDGWTGWAPLPPSARFEIGTGLSWDRRGVEPHWWSFVETRHLLEPSIHLRLAPRPRALTLLERTRDVTRYEHREGSVIARGLDPEEIGRERSAPIRRVEIREVSSPDARRSRDPQRDEGRDQEGEDVDVFRPTVRRPAERPAGEPGDRQPVAVAPRTSESRPPTARELEQSRRALTAWEQEQRRKLDQIHEIEREAPREATQRRDLEKRQEAEREELREEITRQRRSLESRSDRTSRRPVRRPPKRDDQSSPSVGWVEGREGMRARGHEA